MVHQHLAREDKMVAGGRKMDKIILCGPLHVLTHIYIYREIIQHIELCHITRNYTASNYIQLHAITSTCHYIFLHAMQSHYTPLQDACNGM